MFCWGGRKAACSRCRLLKRLSKQVQVDCKCKLSFESNTAHFTWRELRESRGDSCDQYQQVSTKSLPRKQGNHCGGWGLYMKENNGKLNISTHKHHCMFYPNINDTCVCVSSASKSVWCHLSLIRLWHVFIVELVTQPLKTHQHTNTPIRCVHVNYNWDFCCVVISI